MQVWKRLTQRQQEQQAAAVLTCFASSMSFSMNTRTSAVIGWTWEVRPGCGRGGRGMVGVSGGAGVLEAWDMT